jgi:hypothetical protein
MRDVDVLEVADEWLFKKKCVTFSNEDDMDWLKREMGDIKEGMKEITKYLWGDVDYKFLSMSENCLSHVTCIYQHCKCIMM